MEVRVVTESGSRLRMLGRRFEDRPSVDGSWACTYELGLLHSRLLALSPLLFGWLCGKPRLPPVGYIHGISLLKSRK